MRMNKGAILASMAIIMVASVFAGAGTMAWFSDIETGEIGQFTSGTVDLLVAGGSYDGPSGGWKDGVAVDIPGPNNWGPGDDHTVYIWFKNDGSLSVDFMYRRYYGYWQDEGLNPESEIPGWADLAGVIEVTELYEWADGNWQPTNWVFVSDSCTWDLSHTQGDNNGILTLREFLEMHPDPMGWDEKIYDYGNWDHTTGVKINMNEYFLDPDEKAGLKLTFHFMEEADNHYQGDICGFKIDAAITNDNRPGYYGGV